MDELLADVALLTSLLDDAVKHRLGPDILSVIEQLRAAALELRSNGGGGEARDAFAARMAALDTGQIADVAHAVTQHFHLINVAEEQHRVRVLRQADRAGVSVPESIAQAVDQARRHGIRPDDLRSLLARLFVQPVLTAHPTEARRRTVIDHLQQVSLELDRLDDPRPGERERARTLARLREAVTALDCTEGARGARPTPLDEVRAGLHVFERTLLDVTPAIVRELEDALAQAYPGEVFEVPSFLRWGTWIGGDRDGNPNTTAEVTRAALERYRAVALTRALQDMRDLGSELSVSARIQHTEKLTELEACLERDRARAPEVSARALRSGMREPWREKLAHMAARIEATLTRGDGAYPDVTTYRTDLALLRHALHGAGLGRLADGRLRDAERRAEAFGFHLATLDIREHSAVHERAVAELLALGGVSGYASLPEDERASLLCGLLEKATCGPRAIVKGCPR